MLMKSYRCGRRVVEFGDEVDSLRGAVFSTLLKPL
jgi:hypothetical protein